MVVGSLRHRSPYLSRSEKAAICFCTILFVTMTIAMMVAPIFIGRTQCPVDAIQSVSATPTIECMSIMGILMFTGLLLLKRYGRIVPVSRTQLFISAPRSLPTMWFFLLIAGLVLLAAFICLNGVKTYDCVMPHGLLSRGGLLNTATEKSWSTLNSVTAECELVGKTNTKTGSFRLRFKDQSSFHVPLVSLDKARALISTIGHTSTKVKVSSSVTEDRCPVFLLSYMQELML